MKDISTCFSHNSDEWETPKDLFGKLDKVFNFDIDLYASCKNHLCDLYYTKENPCNDFLQDQIIYANPPYSKLKECIKQCYELSKFNFVVMLIPARTDTIAFHEYIYNNPKCFYVFLKGRLKFTKDGKELGTAPFPSMVVFMGDYIDVSKHK